MPDDAGDNTLPEDGLTDEQMEQLAGSQESSQPSSQGQAVPEEGLTDEQMDQLSAGQEAPTSSPLGATVRSFARGLLPNSVAGIAGDVAGGAAGAAALPTTGPGAPFIGGAVAAGVAGTVGYAATRVQNELLKKLGLDVEPQEQADVTQNPYWSEVGNIGAMAATFNVGGLETKLAARVIGGSVMGALDVVQQAIGKGGLNNVDPTEAAIAAAGGTMFGGLRKWAQNSVDAVGAKLGSTISRPPPTVAQGGVAGRPNQPQQPDAQLLRTEANNANDVTNVAIGATNDNVAETHQPDTVQPEKNPAATIDVVRSDTKYKKGAAPAEVEGVVGAPSTEGITFDDNPTADIQVALAGEKGGADGAAQVSSQEHATQPNEPVSAPAPAEEQPPIQTGINRRTRQLPITWAERRGAPPLRAQQDQLGEAFQPEPPEQAQSPLANAGRPAAKQGGPTLHGVNVDVEPHVADVVNLPPVQQAVQVASTPVKGGVPKIAVLPDGKRFETAKANGVHDGVGGWVHAYLVDKGMDPAAAMRVAEHDFAKPAQDAYYKGLGVDPDDAGKWWDKNKSIPSIDKPSSEDRSSARDILLGKEALPDTAGLQANPVSSVNGRHIFTLSDTDGSTLGAVKLHEENGGKNLFVDDIQNAEGKPNVFGPRNMRQALEQIKQQFPNAETLNGYRGTGARQANGGGPASINLRPPESRRVSAPMSDREQQILDSLKNLEGGEEAATALAKTAGERRTLAFDKAAQAIKNAPEKRAKVGEVQTGGGARGERKEAATAAVKDAYDKFTPGADEDDQALLDRLQKAVDHAKDQYGGKNPVDRKEGYAPRVKPPEWQFIKKAQQLLGSPTQSDGQISKFRTDEGLLRSGGAKDVQQTKRIEADIEKSARPTSEEADAAGAAEGTSQAARHDFEMMEPWKPGADESKQYIDESNSLRDWINNLDEPDYRAVEAAYPDMAQDVDAAGDPHRLRLQMESDLEGAQQRRGQEQPVPAKEPVKVSKPAITTEPGSAASAGKSRKDLIAEYNAKLKAGELPGGNKLSPEERLAAEKKAQAGNEVPAPKEEPEPGIKEEDHQINPVSGEDDGESAESTLSKFMSDESGAVNLGSIKGSVTGFKNWLNGTGQPRSEHFMAAAPKSAVETAARDAGETMHAMTQRLNDHKLQLLDLTKKIPANFAAKDQLDMYRAMGPKGKVSSLNPQQQAFVRDVLEPLRAQNKVMYDALRTFDPELPVSQLDHVPRRIAGESEFDEKSGISPDPVEGIKRVMSTEPPQLKDRNYMTLEDGAGKRFVAEPYEGGKIKVWQGGKFKIYKAPGFDNTVGKQIDVGGKQYTIQDAAAHEISRNALIDNKPIQYHENAFALLANDSARLFEALQNVKFLDATKQDPRFVYDPKTGIGGATEDFELGKKLGWQETLMPQFKGWMMSDPYRRQFDDYAKPGLKGGDTMDRLRTLGQAVTKTMFWLPTAHLDNVFQHWLVARGSSWLTLQGAARLAKTLPEAIKSVYMQDATQSALRGVGQDRAAGTVYGGVITKDFNQRLAEASMMDMYKNPSKWDPIIRPLGMPLPEFAKAVYRTSSKIMWAGNDMLLTQLYLENKMNGMGHNKAIVEAEKHFPNYRLPTTIMGSRGLQEVVSDPLTVMFGRYHYGMINSYAHIAKDLLGPGASTADRGEAMAKVAMLGLLGFVGYPLMNKMAQYVTGNKDATMQPRGPMAISQHIVKALRGEEGIESAIGALVSTPPLMSTALETLHNTDWRGKKIVEPATMAQIGSPNSTPGQRLRAGGRAMLQEAEHAARGMVSPVNTAELIAARPQSAVASLAAQLADIKNPTPAASRYINKLSGTLQRQGNARFQKPPGMAESVYNKMLGK